MYGSEIRHRCASSSSRKRCASVWRSRRGKRPSNSSPSATLCSRKRRCDIPPLSPALSHAVCREQHVLLYAVPHSRSACCALSAAWRRCSASMRYGASSVAHARAGGGCLVSTRCTFVRVSLCAAFGCAKRQVADSTTAGGRGVASPSGKRGAARVDRKARAAQHSWRGERCGRAVGTGVRREV